MAERLNVGCGRDVRPGWVNVDRAPLPRYLYEGTLLSRLLPARNVLVELVK